MNDRDPLAVLKDVPHTHPDGFPCLACGRDAATSAVAAERERIRAWLASRDGTEWSPGWSHDFRNGYDTAVEEVRAVFASSTRRTPMPDLTTVAGLSMLDNYFDLQRDSGPQVYAAIHAIEAEAYEQGMAAGVMEAQRREYESIPDYQRTERERIRAAVEGRKVKRAKPAEADWARGFRDGWNDALGSVLADIEEAG